MPSRISWYGFDRTLLFIRAQTGVPAASDLFGSRKSPTSQQVKPLTRLGPPPKHHISVFLYPVLPQSRLNWGSLVVSKHTTPPSYF